MAQHKLNNYLVRCPILENELTLDVVTTRTLTTFEWVLLEVFSRFGEDSITWGGVAEILGLGHDNLFVMQTLQELVDLDVLQTSADLDSVKWQTLSLNQFRFTQTGKEIFLQGKLQGRPSTHKQMVYRDEISGQIQTSMATQSTPTASSYSFTDSDQVRLGWDIEYIKTVLLQSDLDYLEGETYITNVHIGQDRQVWRECKIQLCVSEEKGLYWQKEKQSPREYQNSLDNDEIWETELGNKVLEDLFQEDYHSVMVDVRKVFECGQSFYEPSHFKRQAERLIGSAQGEEVIINRTPDLSLPENVNCYIFSEKNSVTVLWKNNRKNFNLYLPGDCEKYPLVMISGEAMALMTSKMPLFGNGVSTYSTSISLTVNIVPKIAKDTFARVRGEILERLQSCKNGSESHQQDILLMILALEGNPLQIWHESPKKDFSSAIKLWVQMLLICGKSKVMEKLLEEQEPDTTEDFGLWILAYQQIKSNPPEEKIQKLLRPHFMKFAESLVKGKDWAEEVKYYPVLDRILSTLRQIPKQDIVWQEINIPDSEELQRQATLQVKSTDTKKKKKGPAREKLEKEIENKRQSIIDGFKAKYGNLFSLIESWNSNLAALQKIAPDVYDFVRTRYSVNRKLMAEHFLLLEKELNKLTELSEGKNSSMEMPAPKEIPTQNGTPAAAKEKAMDSTVPQTDSSLLEDVSLSMNLRNIKETDREIKTILNHSPEPNIAVMELSTKAVKLLLGNQEAIIANGFDFGYFHREGDLVHAGKGLDSNNFMSVSYFKKNVLHAIKKMLRICRQKSIDEVYSVATAAYRNAKNRDEILDIIKDECGLNVQILSKRQEIEATMKAFLFCKPPRINLSAETLMLIDQGGGSTEVTFLNRDTREIVDNYSLNLGTTILHNIFFTHANKRTSFEEASAQVRKTMKERLRYYFSNHAPQFGQVDCIAVGTAICYAAGIGSKKQHGKILTIDQIEDKQQQEENNIRRQFQSVWELKNYLDDIATRAKKDDHREKKGKTGNIDKKFSTRLGLPMYVELMKFFQIPQIIVSGTGLFYGIYFENLKGVGGINE